MARVLKTAGLDPAVLNAACKELQQYLISETNVTLSLANGIWYEKGNQLKPGFVADNQHFFGAELAAVDFQNPSSAAAINAWADARTHGKVQNVVQFPFPPLTRVILANAIYFKGKWAKPFRKDKTLPREFHVPDGGARPVPMMEQSSGFQYQEQDDFQAVELPYTGKRLQMYLFLPATNSALPKFLANLNGDAWRKQILPAFKERGGTVIFPKFKMQYGIVLNDSLQALGMKLAFNAGSANFSSMAAEPLFVSQVKQKSYVAVDEEGTEAAAVTTTTMAGRAIAIGPPPFRMIADRPFFFIIADSQTQAILFMGVVNDPAN
jgi:serpin B